MSMGRLIRGALFLGAWVVGGLAIAFLLVTLRPELVRRGAAPTPAPTQPVASVPAPANVQGRATYADAVQRAAPAVVNIYTARLVTEQIAPSAIDQLFGNLWPRYRQRVERSLGSGVIVDPQGHIITNHHVLANATVVRVQLADGRVGDAQVVGRDPDSDLAVLKIDLPSLPVVPFGRSDTLKVGDVVLAIGNPLGLSQTVTHGIVSATSRQQLGVATFEDFIQTDAAINVGNSGGALIDTTGALVGINTAIVAKNLGVEGIGFAIPANFVRGVLDELIAQGRVIRGWIGIVPEDLSAEDARALGLKDGGVLVARVYLPSPAQRAGLQPGDILIAINGAPVRTSHDAIVREASLKAGSEATLTIVRRRKQFEVRTSVAERPRSR
jgi:serine protease DegS